MAIIAKKGDEDFEKAPAGTHAARCYQVIDIGTQKGEYNGIPNYKHKVLLGFELSDELMEDRRPFSVSGFYTLSLSKKGNLRPLLEGWRGVPFSETEALGFDISKLLGQPCILTVVHNTVGDKTYANILSISKPMKGMEIKPAVNPLIEFSLETDMDKFNDLPQWIQKIISKSVEMNKVEEPVKANNNITIDDFNDDIPF